MIRFQFEYPTRDEYWTMYAEDSYRLHYVGLFDCAKDFVYAVRAAHDELVLLKTLGCLDADV